MEIRGSVVVLTAALAVGLGTSACDGPSGDSVVQAGCSSGAEVRVDDVENPTTATVRPLGEAACANVTGSSDGKNYQTPGGIANIGCYDLTKGVVVVNGLPGVPVSAEVDVLSAGNTKQFNNVEPC